LESVTGLVARIGRARRIAAAVALLAIATGVAWPSTSWAKVERFGLWRLQLTATLEEAHVAPPTTAPCALSGSWTSRISLSTKKPVKVRLSRATVVVPTDDVSAPDDVSADPRVRAWAIGKVKEGARGPDRGGLFALKSTVSLGDGWTQNSPQPGGDCEPFVFGKENCGEHAFAERGRLAGYADGIKLNYTELSVDSVVTGKPCSPSGKDHFDVLNPGFPLSPRKARRKRRIKIRFSDTGSARNEYPSFTIDTRYKRTMRGTLKRIR
jgi:hypothetical protein